ncbi:MAG: DUF2510 domain-containing protein [Pseudolysinimonas sp.]
MTDQATRVVSAGWYQDPASSVQVRWWNGLAWTEHVREKPTVSPVTMGQTAIGQGGLTVDTHDIHETHESSTETHEQRIAAVRDLEHQFGIGAVENPVVGNRTSDSAAGTASATAPATGQATTHSATHTMSMTAAHASTAAAWMISLSPLLALVVGLAAAYVYFYLLPSIFVFVIALAIPYLLCLLWAFADARALRDRGYEPPSPAFAALTGLGYLIVRRTRVPGSGPVAMLLVVGVLAFGSLPIAGALGQTQGLTNALNIQRTISAALIKEGKAVSVNCPPFVDAATVGTLYTCDATTATGAHRTVWVSIDGPDKFSYSFGL